MRIASSLPTPDRLPFLPRLAAWMIRALHGTCRVTVIGREHEDAAWAGGGPAVHVTWHFAFPAIIYYFRNRRGMLMVSQSRDGEWISRILHHLGYVTTRGSSGKGGSAALKEMISYVRSGHGAGIVADGSRGPACKAQLGILLLARYARVPLVPVSMAAHPCKRFRSWDRTMLARPFGRIVFAFGPAIRVERDASRERMEELRRELEDSLNRLSAQAQQAVTAP